MKKFVLELDEAQARVVIDALDLYARLGIGQVDEFLHVLRRDGRMCDMTKAEAMMAEIKRDLFGLTAGASYSLLHQSVPSQYRTAHDVQQVLRQAFAKATDMHPSSVWHHDPLPCNRDVPLAKVKVKGKN